MDTRWLAGFFDGDGCVFIGPDHTGYPRLRIHIVQKELSILEEIAERYGGTLNTTNVAKTVWQLSLHKKKESYEFVMDILPHSRIKTKQLWCAKALLERPNMQGSKLSDKERALRKRIMIACKNLKH